MSSLMSYVIFSTANLSNNGHKDTYRGRFGLGAILLMILLIVSCIDSSLMLPPLYHVVNTCKQCHMYCSAIDHNFVLTSSDLLSPRKRLGVRFNSESNPPLIIFSWMTL